MSQLVGSAQAVVGTGGGGAGGGGGNLKADGSVAIAGHLVSTTNVTHDLGSSTIAMRNLYAGVLFAPASAGIVVRGRLASGSGSTDVVVNTDSRAAGKLFAVENNSSERFNVDYIGNITPAGDLMLAAAKRVYISGNTTLHLASTRTQLSGGPAGADAGITFQSRINSVSSANPDFIFNSDVNRNAGAKLISFQDLGSEKAYLDSDAWWYWPGQSYFQTALAAGSATYDHEFGNATAKSGTGGLFRVNSGGFRKWSLDKEGRMEWIAGNAQTTVGAAGAASALPATPTRYLKVVDSDGTVLVIPAYLAA